MSGYFHRMRPFDFKLVSNFGPIKGSNTVDWPISYEDLSPYYDKVEHEIGISGKVVSHPLNAPRTSKTFPYPPTEEHEVSNLIDQACNQLGF